MNSYHSRSWLKYFLLACVLPSAVQAAPAELLNISTRGVVGTGGENLIAGFIIGGASKTVLVKARGPSLPSNLGPISDPYLQLFSGQDVIAENDDWVSSQYACDIQASGKQPADSKEAAILITLPPGGYTAIVSNVNGTVGAGIIGVDAVDVVPGSISSCQLDIPDSNEPRFNLPGSYDYTLSSPDFCPGTSEEGTFSADKNGSSITFSLSTQNALEFDCTHSGFYSYDSCTVNTTEELFTVQELRALANQCGDAIYNDLFFPNVEIQSDDVLVISGEIQGFSFTGTLTRR